MRNDEQNAGRGGWQDGDLRQMAEAVAACATMAEVLGQTARAFPGRTFLVCGAEQFSYAAFDVLVNRCCRYLESLGVQSGDVVSAVLRNSVDYLLVYFACLRRGAVLNPFPAHLNAAEVLDKATILSPRVLFCHKSHARDLAAAPVPVVNLDALEGGFVNALSAHADAPFATPSVAPDSTAVMYYSSGTTGSPKIIEYTHAAQIAGQASMLRGGFTRPGGVHLCVLPLGHTAALRYTIKPCVCTGSTVVLHESFWKVRNHFWEALATHRVNFVEVVPSILIAILNTPYPEFRPEQAASLDCIGCGSSTLPVGLQDAFEARFGVKVINLYGLSETGGTHFDDPRRPGRTTGNIGRPFDVVDAKVFADNGEEAAPGEVGQIGVRGPTLLKTYHGAPEMFAACFRKGYFMTGDLGFVDADGLWHYADRLKDLIIKGGVNLVPSQIDEVLYSHPAVEEVATLGKPDPLWGEVVKCFVVLKQGRAADAAELIALCRERLGDFKAPSQIEFVESLPKGPSGKILKRQLREQELLSAVRQG